MTNKEMFRDIGKPSLAQRMFNIMKNAKSVTKETARGGVPYKIVTHNEVNNSIKAEMIKEGIIALPHVYNHTKEGNFTALTIKKIVTSLKDLLAMVLILQIKA